MDRAFPFVFRSMLVLAGCLLTFGSTGADAYTLTGKTWPAGSNIVVQLGLGQAAGTLSDGNTSWNTAASPVLDMWNQRMDRIRLTGVVNASAPVVSGDHVNSVVFSSTVFGQSFGTGTLAVCYYMMQGSAVTEADVLFNRAQTFDSYRGPLRFGGNGYATGDIRRTFLHELGHGLGLNHSGGDCIMAPTTSDRETLASDDIAGIQSMYGAPPAPLPTPTPPPATGSYVPSDFNGDSKQDIVWQNNATGERNIWFMDRTNYAGERYLPTVPTSWQVAATGDFNGDGHADIVWQNLANGQRAVWLMNGTTRVGDRALPTIPPVWLIASTGDFNRDGQLDLVWQNSTTGQRCIWLLNGTTRVGDRTLPTVAPSWQIVGTDDFNSDLNVDLLWQNVITGQRTIWLMNGSTRIGDRTLPTVPIQWRIAGTGEFNGDGKADILWQNTATGQRAIWLLNGTTRIGDVSLSTIAPQWEIRNH